MPTFNFNLNAQVQLQTVVSSQGGGSNNVATVNVIAGTTTVWSGVMIQMTPHLVMPQVQAGDTIIAAGSSYTLTVPTSLTNGNVVSNITYTSPPNPEQIYNGQIATWTLTQT